MAIAKVPALSTVQSAKYIINEQLPRYELYISIVLSTYYWRLIATPALTMRAICFSCSFTENCTFSLFYIIWTIVVIVEE